MADKTHSEALYNSGTDALMDVIISSGVFRGRKIPDSFAGVAILFFGGTGCALEQFAAGRERTEGE